MRLKNILSLTVTLFLVACAEDVQVQKSEQRIPLHLAAVPQATITRESTEQNKLFDPDEIINAYISVTGASDNTTSLGNPIALKTAGVENGVNPLSPNDGSILYFPPGNNVNVDIYALYPSSVLTSVNSFSVITPQTDISNYKASDLMYASATSPKTDQTIHLQFDHKMAKLIINASGEENLTMKKITLKTLSTTIGWTPSTGVLGSISGTKQDIVIAEKDEYDSSLSGVALFPPQTKNDTYFMEVVCKDPTDNNEKTAYFNICTKDFEEGKSYIVNVKIGPKNLKDDGVVLIDPWPATVGTVNIEAVGNLGLEITALANNTAENTSNQTFDGSALTGENAYHYTYNGKYCKPLPTVTDGKETNPTQLGSDDYDVKYYNNLNAGTALVVVTGKGEYEGISTFATFTINRAANTMSYPNNNADFESNLSKSAIVQNALVKPSFQTNEVYGQMTFGLYSDAACTSTYTGDIATIGENGNVFMQKKGGPIYVKASMDNTGNFEATSCSYKLTITAGDASSVMTVELLNPDIDTDSYYYTGETIQPEVRVIDNGNNLIKGTNYTVSYGTTAYQTHVSSGNNMGSVTITGIGDYTGTKTVNFKIIQASNEWTANPSTPSIPIDCGANATIPQGYTSKALSVAAGTFTIGGSAKFGTVKYKIATTQSQNTNINDAVTVDSSSGVVTGAKAGTTTVTAYVEEESTYGDYTELSTNIDVTAEQMSYIFVYNGTTGGTNSSSSNMQQESGGSEQTFTKTFTKAATLTAELVGAGGGNDNKGKGGYGGHVKATNTFTAESSVTWYVYCGGGGGSDFKGAGGGWNGGGHAGNTGASGGGGGMTCIDSNAQANWTSDASTDTRILVAGGGGGASNGNYGGGDGGASDSGDNTGTWQGQNKATHMNGSSYLDGGGGGAGWIGGKYGSDNEAGGHGGSNYIKSGWTSVINGSSGDTGDELNWGHAVNGSSASYSNENHTLYPGYVIITIAYQNDNN